MSVDSRRFRTAERRIEWWTLGLGSGAAALAAGGGGVRTALGIAAGTLLAWANFRWLRSSVSVLEALSLRQAGEEKPRVPRRVYVRLIAGYALLLALVCASFFSSVVPAFAVVGGLLSLVAAVIAEGMCQLARGWREHPQ
jgi:hypothetical protein